MFQPEDIVLESGKVREYLHHIDTRQFGGRRLNSAFLFHLNDVSVLMDAGTSDEVHQLIKYFKKNSIPLSSFKYLIPSQHHFDHAGGFWKLYEIISKENPDVKILTNEKNKQHLNDSDWHMKRGRSTYGIFVGEMRPIPDEAFEIITPTLNFNNYLTNENMHHLTDFNGNKYNLIIFNTPGHVDDHQCPAIVKNDEIDFMYFGEACGTLYHSSQLTTLPTSMPPQFNYETFMKTLNNLSKLEINSCGFGHFGFVNKKENVKTLISDQISFLKEYREKIIELYNEEPSTRYIVENIQHFIAKRSDILKEDHPVLSSLFVALIYGVLMDLGYREDGASFK